ncbi:helix-turn-helix domain-containing protein [Waddlia chondrophila]|nr:helix-turn-helix transcriptional regulator [Waddlia chondrophila]
MAAEDRIVDNNYHRVFFQHYRVCICFSDRDTLDDLRVKDMTLKKKKDPILVDFAAKVRNMRHSIPLTQEQLAERAGFHVNYIGGIERAERNPSLTSLCSLSKALGCPLKELLPKI